MAKKICNRDEWTRNEFMEEEGRVHRWFEKDDGTLFSVVEGYFPGEANLRVSPADEDSFEIRGHKSTILNKSDCELVTIADKHIEIRRR